MKRGTVYWINLEPSSPPEFGKIRPGVIVSNSEQNLRLPTLAIVPLSSQPPDLWPLRVKVKIMGTKDSYAVIPGIRQINKKRLSELIGVLPTPFLSQLDEALDAYLKD